MIEDGVPGAEKMNPLDDVFTPDEHEAWLNRWQAHLDAKKAAAAADSGDYSEFYGTAK